MRITKFRLVSFLLLPTILLALSVDESNGQPASTSGKVSQGSQRFRSVQSFRRTRLVPPSSVSTKKEDVLASLDKPDRASLWSDRSPFFFTDKRASRVGDIITVVISESSNAKKEADTDIGRQSSLAYTLPSLPGFGEPTSTVVGSRARR